MIFFHQTLLAGVSFIAIIHALPVLKTETSIESYNSSSTQQAISSNGSEVDTLNRVKRQGGDGCGCGCGCCCQPCCCCCRCCCCCVCRVVCCCRPCCCCQPCCCCGCGGRRRRSLQLLKRKLADKQQAERLLAESGEQVKEEEKEKNENSQEKQEKEEEKTETTTWNLPEPIFELVTETTNL